MNGNEEFSPEDREDVEFWLESPHTVKEPPEQVRRLLAAYDAIAKAKDQA